MPATHDDAILMIELAKWGSMSGVDEAIRELFGDGFDAETAEVTDPSRGDAQVRRNDRNTRKTWAHQSRARL